MLFLKMMMAKRRKILTFHLWLNDLAMDEMFLGPFVYGNSVEQIVKSGTSSRTAGEWAEQTGGGEGAHIFEASRRLPSLSYIATAKEINMCDEISCARARTKSETFAQRTVRNFVDTDE